MSNDIYNYFKTSLAIADILGPEFWTWDRWVNPLTPLRLALVVIYSLSFSIDLAVGLVIFLINPIIWLDASEAPLLSTLIAFVIRNITIVGYVFRLAVIDSLKVIVAPFDHFLKPAIQLFQFHSNEDVIKVVVGLLVAAAAIILTGIFLTPLITPIASLIGQWLGFPALTFLLPFIGQWLIMPAIAFTLCQRFTIWGRLFLPSCADQLLNQKWDQFNIKIMPRYARATIIKSYNTILSPNQVIVLLNQISEKEKKAFFDHYLSVWNRYLIFEINAIVSTDDLPPLLGYLPNKLDRLNFIKNYYLHHKPSFSFKELNLIPRKYLLEFVEFLKEAPFLKIDISYKMLPLTAREIYLAPKPLEPDKIRELSDIILNGSERDHLEYCDRLLISGLYDLYHCNDDNSIKTFDFFGKSLLLWKFLNIQDQLFLSDKLVSLLNPFTLLPRNIPRDSKIIEDILKVLTATFKESFPKIKVEFLKGDFYSIDSTLTKCLTNYLKEVRDSYKEQIKSSTSVYFPPDLSKIISEYADAQALSVGEQELRMMQNIGGYNPYTNLFPKLIGNP